MQIARLRREGRCRASCIGDGSSRIVSSTSGLMFTRKRIVVSVAAGGLRGEVREYGRIANTPTALDRWLRKLGGDGVSL